MNIKKITTEVQSQTYLRNEDIPNINLYMDQILTLFNETLPKRKTDRILTKTMINNYSKAKIITPLKGKKYTKEQIIQILMIYELKNNVSLQDIKKLLDPINYQQLSSLYQRHTKTKDIQAGELDNLMNTLLTEYQLDLNNDEDKLLTILAISSLMNQLQDIIDLIKE